MSRVLVILEQLFLVFIVLLLLLLLSGQRKNMVGNFFNALPKIQSGPVSFSLVSKIGRIRVFVFQVEKRIVRFRRLGY